MTETTDPRHSATPDDPDGDGPPRETPVPPDAPVETPEADPRTEQAPDGGDARPADRGPRPQHPSDPASTEEQIQQAFDSTPLPDPTGGRGPA